jgi:hypothetical protein
VRVLIQLSRDHFKNLTIQGREKITEYDSEVIRLMAFLIESDLIFSESFDEGMFFVNDIFGNIGQFMINSIQKQSLSYQRRSSTSQVLNMRRHHI